MKTISVSAETLRRVSELKFQLKLRKNEEVITTLLDIWDVDGNIEEFEEAIIS